MASSGNTWQKKLMNKARLHHLKVKGVKQRFAVDKISTKPVPTMASVISGEVELREFNAPIKVGFKPRPFGKKISARTPRGVKCW